MNLEKRQRSIDLNPSLGAHEKTSSPGHIDVTMLWDSTVVGNARLQANGTIRIGEGAHTHFQVSDKSIGSESFDLVSFQDGQAIVHLNKGMKLSVNGAENTQSAYTLRPGETATVSFAQFHFQIAHTKAYPVLLVPFWESVDYIYARIASICLMVVLATIMAFFWSYHMHEDSEEDLMANLNKFQKLLLEPTEEKKVKEDLSGKEAARHKDDEGLFGKKDKPQEDKAASKDGAPKVDKDKREEDRKLVFDQLAAWGLQGPESAVSNVFGPGGLGAGENNALGGLAGTAMGDAGGAGGLGSRGTGSGGGGTGLGIGGLGSGTGRGTGGSGDVNLGGRGKGRIRVQPGNVITKGSLTKEEINRVVQRHMSQIKHCYEQELNKDPKLQGKLVGSWTIAASGSVAAANISQNTMGNDVVGSCVTRIIQRMRFPTPRGGGQVFVSYPFVFAPSG